MGVGGRSKGNAFGAYPSFVVGVPKRTPSPLSEAVNGLHPDFSRRSGSINFDPWRTRSEEIGAVKAKKEKNKVAFNVDTFLATMDGGRSISTYRKHQKVFSQGDPADAVFYIQEGKVKVCVINELGKEAVVAIHDKENFFGEGCLLGQPLRLATVATMTECSVMRIEKSSMLRVLQGGAEVFRAVHGLSVGTECPCRGGLGRSTCPTARAH
jgi:Cyclic nucleotide-binding domain